MLSRLGKIDQPYYSTFREAHLKNIDLTKTPSFSQHKKIMEDDSDTPISPHSPHSYFSIESEVKAERNPSNSPLKLITLITSDRTNYRLIDIKHSIIHYNHLLPSRSILKMKFTGNKLALFDRLRLHLNRIISAKLIQRAFRGHCVRYCHRLRFDNSREKEIVKGKSRTPLNDWLTKSTNKTDFFSLEPIENMPKQLLYFYVDKQGFVYTFNIFTLLQYFIKNKGRLVNPYNREKIENSDFSRFYNLGILAFKLYSKSLSLIQSDYNQFMYHVNRRNSNTTALNAERRQRRQIPSPEQASVPEPDVSMHSPTISSQNFMTQEELIIENLVQLRSRSLNSRIINAFMEIDSLGGYHTKHTWFTELNKNSLARFYSNYFEWWYNSSELLASTKHSICIFSNPFLHIEYLDNHSQVSLEDYREACIYLIENMIHAGVDDEHRKLGAFQALTVLSQVSLPARIGLGYI